MAHRRKRRLGDVSKENILEADNRMKRACPARFKTKQYVSACLKITGVMTKELVKRGSKLTHQDIAAAANAADKVCSQYKTGQYGSVCARVVGGYIRVVAQIKPHLT
jgi:predicted metal-dependent hydrolase